MVIEIKLSLRALRGNPILVSLRAQRGNPIKKDIFISLEEIATLRS
jgi:hypothetical protein